MIIRIEKVSLSNWFYLSKVVFFLDLITDVSMTILIENISFFIWLYLNEIILFLYEMLDSQLSFSSSWYKFIQLILFRWNQFF